MISGNRAILSHALGALGVAVGNPLSLGEDGLATLTFAGAQTMTVEAPAGSDHIYFHGPISRMPAMGADRLAREALARNLFKVATPGAWISLDERSDTLLLCCGVPAIAIAEGGLAALLVALFAEQDALRRAFEHSAFAVRDDVSSAEPPRDGVLMRL